MKKRNGEKIGWIDGGSNDVRPFYFNAHLKVYIFPN